MACLGSYNANGMSASIYTFVLLFFPTWRSDMDDMPVGDISESNF
jgi:hypothetical protein